MDGIDSASIPVLYGTRLSGNSYKVASVLHRLALPFHWVEVDVLRGENRTARMLSLNPNGKLPFLRWPDGRILAESNAILVYVAEDTALWPTEAWQRAQALQWLFFEQYSHGPYIANARFIRRFLPADHPRHAELTQLQAQGAKALAVMEQHLQQHAWFTGDCHGLADIALYAYTHTAPEAGLGLGEYPAIQAWLARVVECPGHLTMAQAACSLRPVDDDCGPKDTQ
ncbi:MAG: glutathione S-transferase family protein [Xanthomonadales bacterium]|jgi:glutathione S-transferase|nr:glutathione S-transferase family protein [Xanthomonadales bacterium]